jgi:hypothetical protein
MLDYYSATGARTARFMQAAQTVRPALAGCPAIGRALRKIAKSQLLTHLNYAIGGLLLVGGESLRRQDPIGPESPWEGISDAAFYLAAVLSIVVLLIDKTAQPKFYGAIQATFAVTVVAFFVSGIVVKTYFAARAHSSRFSDFVSNAFSVPLVPDHCAAITTPRPKTHFLRMAASALENRLFTKSILRKMLRFERARISIYVIAWLWAAFYRATDLELLAVAAQVLFSEQLLSRWIRMEWLRSRVEGLYILDVPQRQRTAGSYRHLAKVMTEFGWTAVRVRDFTRGGYREQVRGYVRGRNQMRPAQ